MRYLLLLPYLLTLGATEIQAQASTVEEGCYIEFATGECQESKGSLWINYGPSKNINTYGAPVGMLLNQAVKDRERLLDWIAYAHKLEKRNKKLKVRARPASSCK